MIIADTSGLLAFFNAREPAHVAVTASLGEGPDDICVSPYVIAELNYLVATRIGVAAERAVLAELSSGAYELAQFGAEDIREATEVIERYADQSIGIADASLVVLAARHRTRNILTLDRRHFEVLRPLQGGRFTLLPRSHDL